MGPTQPAGDATWTRISFNRFQTLRRHTNLGGAWGQDQCLATARVLAHLLRPRPELESYVRAELARVPSPYVAMHVRHGDKATETKNATFGLSAYLDVMRARLPHVRNVWLMTEDDAVIEETRRHPDMSFFFTNTSRTNQAEWGQSERRTDETSFNSLVNLYLAADADAFIGTLSSNWGRLVVMLGWGKYGRPPPCFSLHGTWAHYGWAGCFKAHVCQAVVP